MLRNDFIHSQDCFTVAKLKLKCNFMKTVKMEYT